MLLSATSSSLGILALIIFIIGYLVVILEEFIHLRKSKPVILASGIIWIFVAIIAHQHGTPEIAETAVKHNIQEYAELFLFLLVAMTYINSMEERGVFDALRCWLVNKHFSFRQIFWITGFLSFFISPFADNLTTALIMCAVVMTVGHGYTKFISLSCINIVIAANAGGAFSPFGDITTLMVWQKGVLQFHEFADIFIPSLISYLVPATIMSIVVPKAFPTPPKTQITMAFGAVSIIILFILTIVTTVAFHYYLHLPPAIGMMTGLSYLKFFGYYLKIQHNKIKTVEKYMGNLEPFDIIKKIERVEWDTLLFFYGIMLCVGGLATIGYLEIVSTTMYKNWGAMLPIAHKQTPANITIGLLSSIIDNIPVMYAVITMYPKMSEGQWLLVTLTTGIGGSLLSIGSAAGVALMGQAKGIYTFFGHLKWTWIIFIGYLAGVATHIWMNSALFNKILL